MTKEPSEKQLAARKKLGEAAKARAAAKRAEKEAEPTTAPEVEDFDVTDFQEQVSNQELQRQLSETQETLALLKAAFLGKDQGPGLNIGRKGSVVGEVEKYVMNPSNYPDPTKRLAKETRLAPLAFDYNYELEYSVSTTNYETKAGINMREPRFNITLLRKVLDAQGNRVQIVNPKTGKLEDKYYIARKLIFHEDPQAALVVARDNRVTVDEDDEKLFLNEMRYLRVRDWLFDIFWPSPIDPRGQLLEEVIGGQVVQVFTKSSEDSSEIDFSQIGDSKLRV